MSIPKTIQSEIVFFTFVPVIISTFAKPKSTSKISTLCPKRLKDMAKLTAKFVFPTPPLPLVTANTLALLVSL